MAGPHVKKGKSPAICTIFLIMLRIIPTLVIALLLCLMTECNTYQNYIGTIELNGQSLFYAVEGKGKPVVLIHGNGGSHNDLDTAQHQLAQAGYTVYAMDSRGQGANTPLAEYHYKDMAEDVLAFIRAKGLHRPAVYGWSDGGIIALELESMHPGTCSIIVTSGANITAQNAISHEMEIEIFGTRENWDSLPPLVRLMHDEPNMTRDDMQKIQIPVLVCAGEHDLILPAHTRLIAESLPQGEMLIVPGEDHGSYIWHNPKMGEILLDFFRKHNY